MEGKNLITLQVAKEIMNFVEHLLEFSACLSDITGDKEYPQGYLT